MAPPVTDSRAAIPGFVCHQESDAGTSNSSDEASRDDAIQHVDRPHFQIKSLHRDEVRTPGDGDHGFLSITITDWVGPRSGICIAWLKRKLRDQNQRAGGLATFQITMGAANIRQRIDPRLNCHDGT
jgi:hypothetical protein